MQHINIKSFSSWFKLFKRSTGMPFVSYPRKHNSQILQHWKGSQKLRFFLSVLGDISVSTVWPNLGVFSLNYICLFNVLYHNWIRVKGSNAYLFFDYPSKHPWFVCRQLVLTRLLIVIEWHHADKLKFKSITNIMLLNVKQW